MLRLVTLMYLTLVTSGATYRAPKFCTTNSKNELTYCGKNPGGHPCLFYHPKEEFCEDENAPLPTCCRAVDEKGFSGCGCCRSVYGSKHLNNNAHTYHHEAPEVTYDISK